MQTLFSKPSANFKVNKNLAFGYYTPILHLAPHDLSGRNVCKKSKPPDVLLHV